MPQQFKNPLIKTVKELQLSTSKRIGELEANAKALEGVNINQESKIAVSTYDAVTHLPKNAANGGIAAGVKGQTVINIGGNKGECEDTNNFSVATATLSLDSVNKIIGNNSIIATSGASSGGFGYHGKSANIGSSADWKIDNSKYYFASGYIRNIDANGASFRMLKGSGGGLIGFNSDITGTSFIRQGIKMRPSDLIGETDIRPYVRGEASAIGQKVAGDGLMVVEITANDYNNLSVNELLVKYPYVSNTKSTIPDIRLKSVGKNLIPTEAVNWENGDINVTTGANSSDGSSYRLRLKGYVQVIPNKTYPRTIMDSSLLTSFIVRTYDNNKKYVNTITTSVSNMNLTIPDNVHYLRFVFADISSVTKLNRSMVSTIFRPQLEQGTTATPYQPYIETEKFISAEGVLRSVPNGVRDEIKDGQKYKRVSDEYVIPLNINITVLDRTNYTQIITVDNYITNVLGSVPGVEGIQGTFRVDGWTEKAFSAAGEYVPKLFSTRNTNALVFDFPLGTTATQAKEQLAGTVLIYQLATPITNDVTTFGNLISQPSGTVYFDSILGDINFYGASGITVPVKTFASIEKVLKVDMQTGVETDITANCTLNGNKDGFTSTALVTGDLVWYELKTLPKETTQGELGISYFDSRYAVVDTNDGKTYGWKIVSTDGVPSIVLTEL